MTIETGVVKGNIDRVVAEIGEMIKAASAGGSDVSDIKSHFDTLVLQAESFLKRLDQLDSAEKLLAESTVQTPEVEAPDVSANIVDSETSIASSSNSDINSKLVSKTEPNKAPDEEAVEVDKNKAQMSVGDQMSVAIDSIQVQLSEIIMRLDELSAKVNNAPMSPEPVPEVKSTIETESSNTQLQSYLQGSKPIDVQSVREIMKTFGESVMDPSEPMQQFWSKSAQQDSFNDVQKKLLTHLATYQTNVLSGKSEILPSPWEKGMKDLFA